MVGLMTFGKRKYESLDDVMRKTIGPLHDNLQKMLPLIDKDSEAFTDYMVALKLPQTTESEKLVYVYIYVYMYALYIQWNL